MNKKDYNLMELLGDHFCVGNNITDTTPYEILEIDAKKLIVPSRIDLIAKYKYIEAYDKNLKSDFEKELYDEHIRVFTYGTCVEPGNPLKNSLDEYKKVFNNLIEDIKYNGFDSEKSIIPVGKDFGVLDGAHRAACAAYFNKKVTVIRFPQIQFSFDYEYFKKGLLDDVYLDYMLSEYCNIKDNVFVANIWPVAKDKIKREEIKNIFSEYGKIVAIKEIELSYLGYRNYMLQIYNQNDWIGTFDNHFKGVMNKVDACYGYGGNLQIYIFECDSLNKVLKLKKRIREIFGIGNHSIHISDNQKESIQMLELILNKNSLELMNNCQPDKFEMFCKNIKILKEKIQLSNANRQSTIIVSKAVLSLYGVKDFRKISWISEKDGLSENDTLCTHEFENKLVKNILLRNPKKYLYFWDLKFITLTELKTILELDEENSELIELISSTINNFNSAKKNDIKTKVRRKVNYIKRNIINRLIVNLRRIGIYETMRKIYRKIK